MKIRRLLTTRYLPLAVALFVCSWIGLSLMASNPQGQSVLEGKIIDKLTKKVLEGAVIELKPGRIRGITDRTGTFQIAKLASGTYEMLIKKSGYQSVRIVNFKIDKDVRLNFTHALLELWAAGQSTVEIEAGKLNLVAESIYPVETEFEETKDAAAEKSLKKYSKILGMASGKGSLGVLGGSTHNRAPAGFYNPSLNPPNGQKFHDMYHYGYGTNPFIDTEDDKFSTFGADVSTASYTLVRSYINRGALPPKDAVRVEEFVNYMKQQYKAPSNETFAVYTAAMPSPISKNTQLVRIGLRGKEVDPADRKPANLTFVVDISGSMGIENRLGLVKKTLLLLAQQMREGDRIGIVVYGTNAYKVLDHTGNREAIISAVNRLGAGGSTNAEAGLWLGYELASQKFNAESINRVILCTDGVANNGETSSSGLLKNIEKFRKRGITLTSCGFGMNNYNDVLLEQLATKGDGNYFYIDDMKEAKRVFVEQLTGTLQVIAKDVKIQVEFDPRKVSRYRLVGFEKRDVADKDFRNDTVDGGEIGAGHSVTALYEVKLTGESKDIGVIRIRYKSPDGQEVKEISSILRVNPPSAQYARDEFTFVQAVMVYAEIMRKSYWAKQHSLSEVKQLLASITPDFKQKFEQYQDFAEMVGKTLAINPSLAEASN